uniref:Uncharacterized protein n=1 Tax=Anguilla anguilla TaxID=7936 RepID=A0A0E9XLM4_ANGAN
MLNTIRATLGEVGTKTPRKILGENCFWGHGHSRDGRCQRHFISGERKVRTWGIHKVLLVYQTPLPTACIFTCCPYRKTTHL